MAKTENQRKVLRIGIVQGGRIVEERLLRKRDSVSIGQSPKNDFIVPSPEIPLSYSFITRKGKTLLLSFEKGMFGKVFFKGEVFDLKTLARQKLAQRQGNRFLLALDDSSRGKLVLGDITLLFQFVSPPPDVPRLQLPASAKGAWWRNMDRPFMVILMLSFLFQGGLEGYQEYYWRNTGRFLVQNSRSVPKILQTLVKVEKQEEEKAPDEGDEATDKEAEFKDQEAEKADDKLKEAKTELLESKEGEDQALEKDESNLDLADPTDMIADSMGDMKDDLRGQFEEKVGPEKKAMSAEERLARADRMVSNRTVAGVLGSAFGAGDGGMDVLSGGAKAGREAGWGEGDITVGGADFGGPKSDIFDDSVGALMDNGGIGAGIGAPNIAANLELNIQANAGPTSAEAIAGPKKKLEIVKKGSDKKKEKKIRVRVRGGQISGVIGGKIDKAALQKYVRQRTVSVQR